MDNVELYHDFADQPQVRRLEAFEALNLGYETPNSTVFDQLKSECLDDAQVVMDNMAADKQLGKRLITIDTNEEGGTVTAVTIVSPIFSNELPHYDEQGLLRRNGYRFMYATGLNETSGPCRELIISSVVATCSNVPVDENERFRISIPFNGSGGQVYAPERRTLSSADLEQLAEALDIMQQYKHLLRPTDPSEKATNRQASSVLPWMGVTGGFVSGNILTPYMGFTEAADHRLQMLFGGLALASALTGAFNFWRTGGSAQKQTH